jgi:hypothetical protein
MVVSDATGWSFSGEELKFFGGGLTANESTTFAAPVKISLGYS